MHISDIRKFLRCPRMYQLSLKDASKGFPYFNITIDVDASILRKLDIHNYYTGQVNQSNEDTFNAFKEYNWITKARFSYRGLRIRIPYLYHEDEVCDLYFTSFSAYPNVEEAINISWNVAVMEKLDLKIRDIFIIHINKDYIRGEELDDEQLWTISDHFYNGANRPGKNIRQYIRDNPLYLDYQLDSLFHFDSEDFEISRSNKCTGKKKCQYYDDCFPFEKRQPDNSILTLVSSQYKYQMFTVDNIRRLKDADPSMLEGTPQQYAQIEADRSGGQFVDKLALCQWLKDSAQYPLSFIDFEWDLFLVPPYEKMHPLEVLPFQYSLHVMDEEGRIEHHQLILEGDCRREFIENMLRDLPEKGSIFAYNAKGAEVLRLSELQEAFPEYHDQLEEVKNRFIDLSVPFVNGTVYDVRMRGLYSLKVIQKMIDADNSYNRLEIENGLEAVEGYRRLLAMEDGEEKQQLYEGLYKYCGLDSYAMIEVYQWLRSLL